MNLAMTMTAFRRPDYLDMVLSSLKKNPGLDDYTLNFGVEPGNSEVISICNNVTFMKSSTLVNQVRLGVLKNPYELLKRTFDAGADGVLYLEDDVVLGPDAVKLSTWYFNQPRRNDFLCMNLYNHDSHADANPASLFSGSKFSALGFALTKEQWKNYFEPSWTKDSRGWDFSITNLISTGLRVLQPRISRSHHIGRAGGVHYLPSRDDKFYVANPMWTGDQQDFAIEADE